MGQPRRLNALAMASALVSVLVALAAAPSGAQEPSPSDAASPSPSDAASPSASPSPAPGADCPDPVGVSDPFDTLVHDPDYPDVKDDDDGRYSVQLSAARTEAGAKNAYDVVLNGGGYGHGIGMSQYGAQGAAAQGCIAEQILTTYFPGTALNPVADRAIRVGVFPYQPGQGGASKFGIRSRGTKALTWQVDGTDLVAQPPEGGDLPVPWYVCARSGGGFTLETSSACSGGGNIVAGPAGAKGSLLTVALAPGERIARSTFNARQYARGVLTFRSRASDMTVTIHFTGLDAYLYGLGEVPSSWEPEAMGAQAILARSYALTSVRDKTGEADGTGDDCDCDIYPSTYDQAYIGYDKEDPAVLGQYATAWPAAVDATSGVALTYTFDGAEAPTVVRGFYSSSHGGVSADPLYVWGTPPDSFPYLQSVDTSAWERYEASGNRLHRWSVGFTKAELAARFGLDEFASLRIETVEAGGRAIRDPDGEQHGAVVTGRLGGKDVTLRFSGEALRSKLGLHSALFQVADAPPPVGVGAAIRLSGTGRKETAIALSQDGWDASADVVLARADHPADALAGSALAGMLDAPLLLTDRTMLPEIVRAEIVRLEATTVWLLGGTGSISADIEAELADDLGLAVERISGPDRFGTAAAIAQRLTLAEPRTAYLIRGLDLDVPDREWADALAVSAIAARRARAAAAWPVLAVSDTLPEATRAALVDLGIERVVAIGGDATVAPGVLEEIAQLGIEVLPRLMGANRWATSRATDASDEVVTQRLIIATGGNYPDGLAAGPFAARTAARFLLVPSVLGDGSPWTPDEHDGYLDGLRLKWPVVVATGGTASVSGDVLSHVLNQAETPL